MAASIARKPTPHAPAGLQVTGLPVTPSPMPGYATPAPPPPVDGDVDPLIGTNIGSFKVLRKIGGGGMGTVYLAEQGLIGSKVAIKVLHPHLASNPSLVQRFYAEARAANLIGHEHIVTVMDLNLLPPNRYYFIMEYLEGRQLSELARPMEHALLVHLVTQVCDALQAAHTNGVVHRDLKPENIVLVKRGRNDRFVKILDFGIAKLFSTELAGQQTAVGVIMGTPEFMAPEQTAAEEVDGRTDIYSLGVIAYELAVGKLPFTGTNVADLLIAQRSQTPVPPHVANPQVPLSLSLAIMKALEKRPKDRWQSADEFCRALEATLDGVDAYRSNGPATSPRGLPLAGPATPVAVQTDPSPGQRSSGSSPTVSVRAPTPAATFGGFVLTGETAAAGAPKPSRPSRPGSEGPAQLSPPSPSAPKPRTGAQPAFVPGAASAASSPSAAAARSGGSPSSPGLRPGGSPSSPGQARAGSSPSSPGQAAEAKASPTPTPGAPSFGWEAKVFEQPSDPGRKARALDINRGGMFLAVDGALPAMFKKVKVSIKLPDGNFTVFGEVIRQVTAEQSTAWNMPVGFGVQYLELTSSQKAELLAAASGQPRSAAAKPTPDDPKAEAVLAPLKKRASGLHYDLFGLPDDADFGDIRSRGRETKKLLAEVKGRPLSSRQREDLDALEARVDEAMVVIGQARNRLDYDAARGNWKGIARCIAGGVSVTELDAARKRYLSTRERQEGTAHLHFTTGNAWESQRDLRRAQEEFERALSLDPLNLGYHQRYQALKRALNTPPPTKR